MIGVISYQKFSSGHAAPFELIKPCTAASVQRNLKQRMRIYLFLDSTDYILVDFLTTSISVLVNVMDGRSDAFTIEIDGLYPVLKISNFLQNKHIKLV